MGHNYNWATAHEYTHAVSNTPAHVFICNSAPTRLYYITIPGADPGFRRGGGFVQEFRLENRSYPDVHDFSLRMQVIIAND